MRRLPSILALATAALVCAVLAVAISLELRTATPDTSPSAAVQRAHARRAAEHRAEFAKLDRSWSVAYDRGMVRERSVWRAEPGATATTDIALVNATPGADLQATARACAESVGATTNAQCYVFASTEAYDFKNVSANIATTQPSAIINLCWAVRASTTRPGGTVSIDDMRDAPAVWDAQQCPDSWQGTVDAKAGR